MRQKFKLFTPIVATLMVLAVTLSVSALFYSKLLFYISAAVTCVVFAVVICMLVALRRRTRLLLDELAESVRASMGGSFVELPTPVMTVYQGREIVWYNDLCSQRVFDGREMRGEDIRGVLPGIDVTSTSSPQGYDVEYGGRRYTVFVVSLMLQSGPGAVIYMVDDTELKFFTAEYHASRPSVALISVDNYDELMQDYKDSERAQLMSETEQAIELYFSVHHGFFSKISRDKFMAVVEARGVREIIAGKFELLDQVRKLGGGNRMPVTLSIGISGTGESLYEAEQAARQALDMCLGRGGDQAAVKTENGYEFYGGISKAVEKRTKVKTRIIANALAELIESSTGVILMGHRFADLDCLGSAVGMLRAVRGMGVPAHICIDGERSLARPLRDRLIAGGYSPGDFLSPADAMLRVEPKTLLIVLDTHIPRVLESEELYRAVPNVVVIDHHRRLVGHIDNAVIFYHEPYASSACEMVTELVQYFPHPPSLTRLEAEALMAGIMLDTKNFVLRTGVRTFEAAAWLRRLGADTVEVRKLFASSMESYQQKASLISTASIYGSCAIAMTPEAFDGIKIVAPQAADEMMSISGVEASFIIFPYEDVVNVSARSMGAINVQLIMEKMGGGGHQTMAAAQFPGADVESVSHMLTGAIDSYYRDIAPPATNQ